MIMKKKEKKRFLSYLFTFPKRNSEEWADNHWIARLENWISRFWKYMIIIVNKSSIITSLMKYELPFLMEVKTLSE